MCIDKLMADLRLGHLAVVNKYSTRCNFNLWYIVASLWQRCYSCTCAASSFTRVVFAIRNYSSSAHNVVCRFCSKESGRDPGSARFCQLTSWFHSPFMSFHISNAVITKSWCNIIELLALLAIAVAWNMLSAATMTTTRTITIRLQ
jgi:hypothetical protein